MTCFGSEYSLNRSIIKLPCSSYFGRPQLTNAHITAPVNIPQKTKNVILVTLTCLVRNRSFSFSRSLSSSSRLNIGLFLIPLKKEII